MPTLLRAATPLRSTRPGSIALACALVVALASRGAAADEAPPASTSADEVAAPVTPRVALRFDPWVDGAVTLGLGAGVLTWGFLKPSLPEKTCTICDPGGSVNAFDATFRDWLVRPDTGPAETVGHVVSYGVSPAMGFALTIGVAAADRRIDEAPANVVMVIEASLTAVVVKEALTYAFPRERPEVHFAEGEARQRAIDKQSDPLESFPSGHVLSIMAITSSSAVIASMRGYRLAPLIWVAGSTLAVLASYLRVAGDQHYMSDNLVGAAIGTGVGAAVPLLFHRPLGRGPTPLGAARLGTSSVPGGRVVTVGWTF